jgi:predicted Rossmann-fold nucleotide-binding protein
LTENITKKLIAYIEKMKTAGTISPEDLNLMLLTDSVPDTIEHIKKAIENFGLGYEKKFKPLGWLLERNGK